MLLSAMAVMISPASGERLLMSNSLNTCQQENGLMASLFNVVYTPSNHSASVSISLISTIQGNVLFDLAISAYGYQFLRRTFNPCEMNLGGLCPMAPGKTALNFNLAVNKDATSQIPDIAYNIPDLDASVRVYVNLTATGESVACLEADVSNGKTVNLLGVKWATAIVAGLSLLSSAVINGLGHSNTAAHIAVNSLTLFGYFQAQAIVGLTSIHLPPIVQAWVLNLQWSMGIIRASFLQDIFTWYQRATGGSPSQIFDALTTVSVQVTKRSLNYAGITSLTLFNRNLARMAKTAMSASSKMTKRGNITTGSGTYIVYGIQRIAFQSGIETTNLFLTGLTSLYVLVVFTVLAVITFKGFCELCVKKNWIKKNIFLEFRNGWQIVLKGILFRIALLSLPQISILCLWEFTQVDSPALVVLAVFFFVSLTLTLAWGAFKVIRIVSRSIIMHRSPAYILFSDRQIFNKWGFLYIQFRASAYYFIAPVLGYTLIKAIFVALVQNSSTTQAIGFVIIEATALITASVMRPWMDKSTNSINITICVINFLNAIFLLIFSNMFDAPKIVAGVAGVVLFVLNAASSLILLVMLIVSTTVIFFRKNPDARYRFMADDRASFIKSQTQLTTNSELDALAATARGDNAGYNSHFDLDDKDSFTSNDLRHETGSNNMVSAPGLQHDFAKADGPQSPKRPSKPLSAASGQHPQSLFRSA